MGGVRGGVSGSVKGGLKKVIRYSILEGYEGMF